VLNKLMARGIVPPEVHVVPDYALAAIIIGGPIVFDFDSTAVTVIALAFGAGAAGRAQRGRPGSCYPAARSRRRGRHPTPFILDFDESTAPLLFYEIARGAGSLATLRRASSRSPSGMTSRSGSIGRVATRPAASRHGRSGFRVLVIARAVAVVVESRDFFRAEARGVAPDAVGALLVPVLGVPDQVSLGHVEALRFALAGLDERGDRGVDGVFWVLGPSRHVLRLLRPFALSIARANRLRATPSATCACATATTVDAYPTFSVTASCAWPMPWVQSHRITLQRVAQTPSIRR
jgi:hypothetical protein